MSEEPIARKLTAILYADVAGYSRLTGDDELGTHRAVMDALDFTAEAINAHGGTVLRWAGDAVLAEYPSVVACVNAAVAIQTELDSRNDGVPEDKRIMVRMGIHLGEVLMDRGQIYGDGVNLAARLEAAAEPGGICISATVHDQINGKIESSFEDGGLETFKNIAKPIRVYRWRPGNGGVGQAGVATSSSDLADKPAIAVLPFNNLSGD
ncbi:MAG TPA: adenylate/guanylate cyclase domain-containing protein, partial [Rhodospirillales bacterium]